MVDQINKARDSSATCPSNKEEGAHRIQHPCTLAIEVIKAWSSTKSKAKLHVLPVVEIQKICEYEIDFLTTYYTNSEA
jgi:hypothetical protein